MKHIGLQTHSCHVIDSLHEPWLASFPGPAQLGTRLSHGQSNRLGVNLWTHSCHVIDSHGQSNRSPLSLIQGVAIWIQVNHQQVSNKHYPRPL